MTGQRAPRHALVLGASGLVGRFLVRALAEAGAGITVAVRSAESGTRLGEWLRAHGVLRNVEMVIVDFDAETILPGGAPAFAHVTEIHNCAGSYRFGMDPGEARRANVGIVEQVIEFAAALPQLQRVVHVSGYRVGGQDPASVPWSPSHRERVYAQLGGYEASKVESDAIFQALAQERGVPWTIVNPASVIGDSATGESDQHIGLAATIEQLWDGTASALPSGPDTFLPVIPVDVLAAFMVAAATDPRAEGEAYWVLDDATPLLPEMLTRLGHHLGVRTPRLKLPVRVIKRLPRWLTRADPETLGFLSADRYPTAGADALAARHGVHAPDVNRSIERWADHLVAHRFGRAGGPERRIVDMAGVPTFTLGDPGSRRVILPGLPVNADTWGHVATGSGARAVDLPGLGLSGGSGIDDWEEWLPALLGGGPIDLIGHSIGAAAAVVAADRFPERVRSLTLVAPFFLQGGPRRLSVPRPLVRAYLRSVNSRSLSAQITGTGSSSAALDSSVSDLRRGRAGSVAAHLSRAASVRWRAELRAALARFPGPVHIITGSEDPLERGIAEQLASRPGVELTSLPGAGHHPQLTHGDSVIRALCAAAGGN